MRLVNSNHLCIWVAKDNIWFDITLELDDDKLWSGTLFITLFKIGVVLEWKVR